MHVSLLERRRHWRVWRIWRVSGRINLSAARLCSFARSGHRLGDPQWLCTTVPAVLKEQNYVCD